MILNHVTRAIGKEPTDVHSVIHGVCLCAPVQKHSECQMECGQFKFSFVNSNAGIQMVKMQKMQNGHV